MARVRRPSVWTAGVVVLGVVALGLATVATMSVDAGAPVAAQPAGDTGPLASASVTSTPSATRSVTPGSSASTTSDATDDVPDVTRAQRPLSMSSRDEAWRAAGVVCGSTAGTDGPVLERTTDGGATWTSVTVPLLDVVGVIGSPGGRVVVVGDTEGCALQRSSSTDSGARWASVGAVRGVWVRERDTVVAPTGARTAPCGTATLVSVERAGSRSATVLCGDGAVLRTADTGAHFRKAGTVRGAVALAGGANGALYVLVPGAPSCAGLAVRASADDGATWTEAGCVDGAKATGGVGFDTRAGVSMVVAGSSAFRSTDGGLTWTTVSR